MHNKVSSGSILRGKTHSQHTLGDFEETLKTLPKGANALNETYTDDIARIKQQNDSDKEAAMKVLSWIFFARRPLTSFPVLLDNNTGEGVRKMSFLSLK